VQKSLPQIHGGFSCCIPAHEQSFNLKEEESAAGCFIITETSLSTVSRQLFLAGHKELFHNSCSNKGSAIYTWPSTAA
jgi:hypothetical protein